MFLTFFRIERNSGIYQTVSQRKAIQHSEGQNLDKETIGHTTEKDLH